MVGGVAAPVPGAGEPRVPVLPLRRRAPPEAPHPALVPGPRLARLPGRRHRGGVRPRHPLQPPQGRGGRGRRRRRAPRHPLGARPAAAPRRAGRHHGVQHRGQRQLEAAPLDRGNSGQCVLSIQLTTILPLSHNKE